MKKLRCIPESRLDNSAGDKTRVQKKSMQAIDFYFRFSRPHLRSMPPEDQRDALKQKSPAPPCTGKSPVPPLLKLYDVVIAALRCFDTCS